MGGWAFFSDPRHHPRTHGRLLEMLAEHGIKTRIANLRSMQSTFSGWSGNISVSR